MELEFEIFNGKSFKDLCKDIYVNQVNRKDQLEILIGELKSMVKTVEDAARLVPLIKEYMDVANTNDEHLIKLAQIIQRLLSAQVQAEADGSMGLLTEEERKQLTKDAEEEIKAIQESESIVIAKIQKE